MFLEVIRCVEGIAKTELEHAEVTPYVSIGGSTVAKPFEFLVREMPESVDMSDRATSTVSAMGARGRYRVEFTVACQAWAKQRGIEPACSAVLDWAERFCSAIAADKTLGGLVVHAQPYIGQCGTAYENDRALYLAAIDLGVRVKADIDPKNL